MALQILESNIEDEEIILAGISKNGYLIDKKLQKVIIFYKKGILLNL